MEKAVLYYGDRYNYYLAIKQEILYLLQSVTREECPSISLLVIKY